MPEAPDLYVVREYLERTLTGRSVARADVLRPLVLRSLAAPLERFSDDIAGRTLDAFWRRGKFLGVELSGGVDGARRTLVVNPMLSGALQHCDASGAGLGADVPDAHPLRRLAVALHRR